MAVVVVIVVVVVVVAVVAAVFVILVVVVVVAVIVVGIVLVDVVAVGIVIVVVAEPCLPCKSQSTPVPKRAMPCQSRANGSAGANAMHASQASHAKPLASQCQHR